MNEDKTNRSWLRLNVGRENAELVNNLSKKELNEELNILRDMLTETQKKFKREFLQRRAGK